jgi:hypothetical protein
MREEKKLRVENAKLKKEIEELKQELILAEIHNGGEYEVQGARFTILLFMFFCHSHPQKV